MVDSLSLIAACKSLFIPGFENVLLDGSGVKVSVSPLAGGLSNTLSLLSIQDNSKTKVIARYSAHRELPPGSCLLDQYTLMKSFPVSLDTPQAFGTVDIHGHAVSFESFIESQGTLSGASFRSLEFASEIGRALGRLHCANSIASFHSPPTLRSRLEMVTKIAGQDLEVEANALLILQKGLEISDAEQTAQIFRSRGCSGDSLIIHADALAGNFLVHQEHGKPFQLSLLDFEYSISAPLIEAIGYELGNAMCEYNYEYDVKEPPGYLNESEEYLPPLSWRTALIVGWASTVGTNANELDVLKRVAHAASRRGMLQSHLFWAAWGRLLDKRKNARSVFDYGKFSKERLRRFKEGVQQLIDL